MSYYTAVGVMSGTSLDGVDLVACTFVNDAQGWSYEIFGYDTIEYSREWKSSLARAEKLSSRELLKLHSVYGTFLGEQVNRFLEKFNIRPDVIASHGHTIFHQPSAKLTFQLGSGASIAAQTGIKTVCDFRHTDVVLGGQGAPLVPIGDQLLFEDYDYCLNLGGIANISFVYSNGRRAFDICPCNMLLNYLAEKLGYSCDRNGEGGRAGTVDKALLEALNALPYYHVSWPKSLGKEWFDAYVIPVLKQSNTDIPSQLATAYEHIADQIRNAIPEDHSAKTMLVSGGGAMNQFLRDKIQEKLMTNIHIPGKLTIEYKEALVFALLGVLRIRGEVNVLSSVTGASRDNCSGAVYI